MLPTIPILSKISYFVCKWIRTYIIIIPINWNTFNSTLYINAEISSCFIFISIHFVPTICLSNEYSSVIWLLLYPAKKLSSYVSKLAISTKNEISIKVCIIKASLRILVKRLWLILYFFTLLSKFGYPRKPANNITNGFVRQFYRFWSIAF